MPDTYDYASELGLTDVPYQTDTRETPRMGDPFFGNMTDDDLLAAAVPGYTAEDSTPSASAPQDPAVSPVISPTQVDHDLLPPIPVQGKQKASVSASRSGFSADKNAQVRRGPGGALDRRIANVEAEGDAKQSAMLAPFDKAREESLDAIHADTKANVDYITAAGHQKHLLAQLQQHYDEQSNQLIMGAQKEAASKKADYIAALGEFRAARVNPTQLWDNMTGGEQLGMLAVAFVQDFLGAKGINTSAMATFNKAIDRNISAQEAAIRQKGDVAQGFKQLWDMQMAESNSLQETRARMRGYMLESAKTAVEAHMAQFDAQLVTAKGQAGIAKMDEELAKNIFEVTKHIDSYTSTRVNQEIQRYGDELRASMDSARIAVSREANQIERDKMKATKPSDPYADLVYDTTQSGNGRPIAVFNEGVSPEEKKNFREQQAVSSKLIQLQREYEGLLLKKNQGALGGTRWQDTDTAKLRNVAYEIFNTRAKIQTGAAITPSEEKRFKTATPEALFGTQFNVRAVVSQTQRHIQDELAVRQQSIARPLHPQDPRRELPNPRIIQGEPEYTEAGIIESGKENEKDLERSIREKRLQKLEKHSAFETYEGDTDVSTGYIKADHERFLASQPDEVAQQKKQIEYAPGMPNVMKGPMNYEVALSEIAKQAEQFKEKAAEGDKAAASRYAELVDDLKNVAAPATSGFETTMPSQYALMKLQDLGEDVSEPGTESVDSPASSVSHEDLPPIPVEAKPRRKGRR